MRGSAGKDRVVSAVDHDAVATPFKKASDVALVDPLDFEEPLQKVEEDTRKYLAEVDGSLSVSNPAHSISIEDKGGGMYGL